MLFLAPVLLPWHGLGKILRRIIQPADETLTIQLFVKDALTETMFVGEKIYIFVLKSLRQENVFVVRILQNLNDLICMHFYFWYYSFKEIQIMSQLTAEQIHFLKSS